MAGPIFRKGLDLKQAVAGDLARDYHSQFLDRIREADFTWRTGRLTLHLAREFGFCYGVDRAVDYAYQTRRKFPDRTVFLTGEIIHNPHVNGRLRGAGIRFLSDPGEGIAEVTADDVVILPAFGVAIAELEQLVACGCTLVDTTCGSVLNVWKNVRRYARDGYTAIIHGKSGTRRRRRRRRRSASRPPAATSWSSIARRPACCASTSAGAWTRRRFSIGSGAAAPPVSTRPAISCASASPTRRRC